MNSLASCYMAAIDGMPRYARLGRLAASNGLVVETLGPEASLGERCEIHDVATGVSVEAEVIGFREGRVLLMPFGDIHGLSVGATVRAKGLRARLPVGMALLGRVVDAFGRPIDGHGPISADAMRDLHTEPMNPLEREEISELLETGVCAIDALLPIGRGQRIGVFAGSGVGKSTLLGMLANHARADAIVVAMIGERGREVGDFITSTLGADGLGRSVVMAATADQPPLVRIHAVYAAHAVAEYFRERGMHVLLILDSMTRFAMAQREIGIAAGEPPSARGYTPSVFTRLPGIVERCGKLRGRGSITAVYSVLVEGDDMNEPVADHMRAILDGHVVLSRELADRGQLPAVDVLRSVSRLAGRLATPMEQAMAREVRAMLSAYERSRDLISMGAYQRGHDPMLDAAVKFLPEIERILRQHPGTFTPREKVVADLVRIVEASRGLHAVEP